VAGAARHRHIALRACPIAAANAWQLPCGGAGIVFSGGLLATTILFSLPALLFRAAGSNSAISINSEKRLAPGRANAARHTGINENGAA